MRTMNYLSAIHFLEKPVSPDEKMIAKVMTDYFEGLARGNLSLLLSAFCDDARIDSKAATAQRIVSKEEYAKAIAPELPYFTKVLFQDLVIRILDPENAFVQGFTSYTFQGRQGRIWSRTWKFTKKNGIWRILESHYNADL